MRLARIGIPGALTVLSLAALGACTGSIDGAGVPSGSEPDELPAGGGGGSGGHSIGIDATPASPGGGGMVSGLRRLTTQQYKNTVQTLLGASVATPLEETPTGNVYTAIGASTSSLSEVGVGQFEDAAVALAQQALGPAGARKSLVPCMPMSPGDAACIKTFVKSFGQRALRRPLTDVEINRYAALGENAGTLANDVWVGLQTVLSAFLQSPNFLYLVEPGEPDPTNRGRYRFTSYEMASRLSYFLTNNTPDDALLAAAASGSLLTTDGVVAQAARLLNLPSAHEAVAAFFSEMLSLGDDASLARDPKIFPRLSAALRDAIPQETLKTVDDLVFTRDGDYRDLFTQRTTFINGDLAALYGVPAAPGSPFAQITLPADGPRAGLLGQSAVLAPHDKSTRTSPTLRGLFVRTRLLCQDIPLQPPDNLAIPPFPSDPNLTNRQKLLAHATVPVCAACHSKMDPLGLTLEHFDALGRYRSTDHGQAIDDSGELDGTNFNGLVGLARVIHDHPDLLHCLPRSFYAVATGHVPVDFDESTLTGLQGGFQTSGYRVRSFLSLIVASNGFRYSPGPASH